MEREFELNWDIGVRTAAVISETASQFASKIQVIHNGITVDAKELMQFLLLRDCPPEGNAPRTDAPGLKVGARFRLIINGPDEEAAMHQMADLFTCGERIDHCPHPECKSTHILIGYTPKTLTYICSKGAWDVKRQDFSEKHV